MTRHRLTDQEIGEALLRHRGEKTTGDRDACLHTDRLWDLARGSLDPEQTGRILDHALECPDCILALRVAREVLVASDLTPEAPRPTSWLAAMWGRLAGSVLRPAPALAYLVLLLVSFPLYRVLTTTAPTAPAAIPTGLSESAAPSGGLRSLHVLRLEGDLTLRGGGVPPAPLRVQLGETDALLLKLFPDVEDLPKDPRATLLVRVLDGETIIAATTRRVADLETDDSLSLLLDRALLRPGTVYRVELTAAGDAGSGAVSPVLRQAFRLDSDG